MINHGDRLSLRAALLSSAAAATGTPSASNQPAAAPQAEVQYSQPRLPHVQYRRQHRRRAKSQRSADDEGGDDGDDGDGELWDADRVCRFFGGCRRPIDVATLYRGMQVGKFPRPIKVGPRLSRWLAHECRAARDRMIAARDQKTEQIAV
jgi:hypothetical protein